MMSDRQLRGDELVSAYLDNEATPAEVAEVEQDGALLARADELRAVRDAVAAPVPPPVTDRREAMLGAALAAADAEAAEHHRARVVPFHRTRRALLAVAAAAIVLAAVASAGLIASRLDDDVGDVASKAAPTDAAGGATQAAPAVDEPAEAALPTTAPASTDSGYDDEMDMAEEEPAEEPMAEEPMAEEEMADEAMADEEMAEEAMDASARTTATPERDEEQARTEPTTDEADDSDPAVQAVDLGVLEDLESLFDGIAAHQSAEAAALTKPGACSALLLDRVLELNGEALRSFAATVGAEAPRAVDAVLARYDDETPFLAFAVEPDCEVEVQELEAAPSP